MIGLSFVYGLIDVSDLPKTLISSVSSDCDSSSTWPTSVKMLSFCVKLYLRPLYVTKKGLMLSGGGSMVFNNPRRI